MSQPKLKISAAPGCTVTPLGENHWRLGIPAGNAKKYRLAELDDYTNLRRRNFPWRPPLTFEIQARASSQDIPGTWGFGFWNDPFSFSLGFGGGRLLPALPNAAWFFFASPPNYLSLRDDLPAQGALAQTFRSPRIPTILFAPLLPLLPLLLIRPIVRLARRIGRQIIRQDAVQLDIDPTEWHKYTLELNEEKASFLVDDQTVLSTHTIPKGPLGLVIWIDSQYACFTSEGRLSYGTLESQHPAWIEVQDINVTRENP